MIIHELNKNFGCLLEGVTLANPVTEEFADKIKVAIVKYKFVIIKGLTLNPDALEKLGSMFGRFAKDPFLENLENHPHVIEVKRSAEETAPIFGSDWHSDWSFQERPPIYTFLYAKKIPPIGGETLFADCVAAYNRLGSAEKTFLNGLLGKHSAVKAYGRRGLFSRDDETRSMKIKVSRDAENYVFHPAVRVISETQERSLFLNPVYTIDLVDGNYKTYGSRINELIAEIVTPKYQYKLSWDVEDLVIWDNRRVIHRAQGGYDGHDRLLLRVTIGSEAPKQ